MFASGRMIGQLLLERDAATQRMTPILALLLVSLRRYNAPGERELVRQ